MKKGLKLTIYIVAGLIVIGAVIGIIRKRKSNKGTDEAIAETVYEKPMRVEEEAALKMQEEAMMN